MFQYDIKTLDYIEKQLRENCPSPESNLIKLGEIVAALPNSKESAKVRHFVLDIDELITEVRWHLAQALLLMKTQVHILHIGEDDDEFTIDEMPSKVHLLLRGFIRQPDRVLYTDLAESRRGGTVAGWIYHIMIDSSIYRSIAALDRIAHILWYAAELPKEQIYFRSKKVKKLDKTFNCVESNKLLKIAESPLLKFIIDYRDGLTHDAKAYSRLAGIPPVDVWETSDGKQVIRKTSEWDAELLFALGNAAYHQLVDVLKYAVPICEKKWPIPSKKKKDIKQKKVDKNRK